MQTGTSSQTGRRGSGRGRGMDLEGGRGEGGGGRGEVRQLQQQGTKMRVNAMYCAVVQWASVVLTTD